MMSHLLATLDAGHSIGHYGRLVVAMVGRHFLSEEDLISILEKDPAMSRNEADLLYRQVDSRDYNPPKRERAEFYGGGTSPLKQPAHEELQTSATGG